MLNTIICKIKGHRFVLMGSVSAYKPRECVLRCRRCSRYFYGDWEKRVIIIETGRLS